MRRKNNDWLELKEQQASQDGILPSVEPTLESLNVNPERIQSIAHHQLGNLDLALEYCNQALAIATK